MGMHYNSSIVKDNLVCLLDSQNPKSWSQNVYPYPLDIGSYITSGHQQTITRDTTVTDSPAGGIPLKIVTSGTSSYTNSYNSSYWNISTAATGDTWNVSFWVKGTSNFEGRFILFEANSAGSYISAPTQAYNITTSWQRITLSRTLGTTGTAFIQFRFDIYVSGVTAWFDGLQIEQGSSATDFNPKRNLNGVSWYDISGNGNVATLGNMSGSSSTTTSGFNTSTKLMMFDRHVGSADSNYNNYANIANSASLDKALITNGMTVSFWLKQTTYTCTAMTKWDGSWEVFYCSTLVWRSQGTGGSDLNTGISYSSYLNKFHMITCTHDGTTRKVYVNGKIANTNSNTLSTQNDTNVVSVGGYYDGRYATIGSIPYYMLYGRVLSDTEIFRNYQATRERFEGM